MRYIVLSLSFLFSPAVFAKSGVVLFNKEGDIIQVNEEVLQYMDNISDNSNNLALKGCRPSLDALASSSYYLKFLKGRPVLEIFTRQEIADLIMDVLQGKERTVEIIQPGREMLEINGTYRTYKYHPDNSTAGRNFVGSLSFRRLSLSPEATTTYKPPRKTEGHMFITLMEESDGTVNNHHLSLYPARNMFFLNDERIRLDPFEFAILHALILEPGKRHDLSIILRDIPPEDSFASQEHHLNSLSDKLGESKKHIRQDEKGRIYLETIISKGRRQQTVEEGVRTFRKIRMPLVQKPWVYVGELQEKVMLENLEYEILDLFITSRGPVTYDMIKTHTGLVSNDIIQFGISSLMKKLHPDKTGFEIIWTQEGFELEMVEKDILRFGNLYMDISQKPLVVILDGEEQEELILRNSRYEILHLLMTNPHLVNYDMARNHIRSSSSLSTSSYYSHISSLRKDFPWEKAGFKIVLWNGGHRLQLQMVKDGIIRFFNLRMDISQAPLVVIIDGEEEVTLSSLEYITLQFFITNPGPMNYNTIKTHTGLVSNDIIQSSISSLMKKLPPEKTGFEIIWTSEGFALKIVEKDVLRFGNVRMDLSRKPLVIIGEGKDQEEVTLRHSRYEILHLLMANPDSVNYDLARNHIISLSPPSSFSTSTYYSHISRLRNDLPPEKTGFEIAQLAGGHRLELLEDGIIKFLNLRMDLSQKPLVVILDGEEEEKVMLTSSEHKILRLLITSPKPVDMDMIRGDTGPLSNQSIKQYIITLKRKLPPEKTGFEIVKKPDGYWPEKL